MSNQNIMSKLQDMIAELDLIVYRLRKVQSGDLIMASDHNDLVESVYQITRIIKAVYYNGLLGGGGGFSRPSNVEPYRALHEVLRYMIEHNISLKTTTNTESAQTIPIGFDDFTNCLICRNSCLDGAIIDGVEPLLVNGKTIKTVLNEVNYLGTNVNAYLFGYYGIANSPITIVALNITNNPFNANTPSGVVAPTIFALGLNLTTDTGESIYAIILLKDNVLSVMWVDPDTYDTHFYDLYTLNKGEWYILVVIIDPIVQPTTPTYTAVIVLLYDPFLNLVYSVRLDNGMFSLITGRTITSFNITYEQVGIYSISYIDPNTNDYVHMYANSKIDYYLFFGSLSGSGTTISV